MSLSTFDRAVLTSTVLCIVSVLMKKIPVTDKMGLLFANASNLGCPFSFSFSFFSLFVNGLSVIPAGAM